MCVCVCERCELLLDKHASQCACGGGAWWDEMVSRASQRIEKEEEEEEEEEEGKKKKVPGRKNAPVASWWMMATTYCSTSLAGSCSAILFIASTACNSGEAAKTHGRQALHQTAHTHVPTTSSRGKRLYVRLHLVANDDLVDSRQPLQRKQNRVRMLHTPNQRDKVGQLQVNQKKKKKKKKKNKREREKKRADMHTHKQRAVQFVCTCTHWPVPSHPTTPFCSLGVCECTHLFCNSESDLILFLQIVYNKQTQQASAKA